MTTTAYYEKGTDTKIAFVLSCPGKEEEEAKKPAAGQTGKNLEDLLEILYTTYKMPEFKRGLITISNSWATIEHKKKTGRSQAKITEIYEKDNLDRLANELNQITDFIICCGDKAKAAVDKLQDQKILQQDCQILYVAHLGNQGLNNTIKKSIHGSTLIKTGDEETQAQNKLERLQVVAKDLIEQIKK